MDIRQHSREQQSKGRQLGRIGYILAGCVTQSDGNRVRNDTDVDCEPNRRKQHNIVW
jgi:hypothetical protein